MVQSESQTTPAPFKTYAFLLAGLLSISAAAIFIRFAQSEGLPSLLIAASRLTLAAIILSPFGLRQYRDAIRQLTHQDARLIMGAGFALALHFATWVTSFEYTSVLISVTLVSTTPLWVAILEVTFLHVRIARTLIAALLLAVAGGIIITLPTNSEALILGDNPLLGALLAVAGAIAMAVYLVIGRKVRSKLPALPYIWLVYSCAAVTSLGIVFMARIPVTGYSPQGYFWLLTLTLFPQLIGHSSLNYALGYLRATIVSLLTQLEPVFSSLFAAIIFYEIPGWLEIVGGMIILAGVALASWSERQTD